MFISAGFELKTHSTVEEDVETRQVHLPPSKSKITKVSICNDNSYIAILRKKEKAQILSAKDKHNIRPIHTINVPNVSAITFKHNTKKNIAMGTSQGDVILYDTKSRTASNIISRVTDFVEDLDFTCDDQQLCGFDKDLLFVFPEINTSNEILKYKQLSDCTFLRCHPFIPNRVAVGCKSGRVALWDVQRGVEIFVLNAFDCPVSGVAMSSCGNFLVASGGEVKICGVELEGGTCSFQLDLEQEKEVSCLDLSPDDRFLVVGLVDGTLKMYNIKQQLKLVYCDKVHEGSVNLIVFENKAKELNSNFSSMIKISEQEIKESNESGQSMVEKRNVAGCKSVDVALEESLEKVKKSLLKIVKKEMDSLENQLQDHCVKFQEFLNKEFETILNIIKEKWDIFTVGDINQLMKVICPDEITSSCTTIH